MNQNTFCKYCHRIPSQCGCTHPVKEHFEDEPQAEELHEIMQSNAGLTDDEAFAIFSDEAMKNGNYDWKAGVRAILRKAQEK